MKLTNEEMELLTVALASAGHFPLPNQTSGERVELNQEGRQQAQELCKKFRQELSKKGAN